MNLKDGKIKTLIFKLLISLSIIIFMIIVIISLLRQLGFSNVSSEKLQEFIKSKGAIAPIIFIIISFLQVTFIPIPSTVSIVVGIYLFGELKAFIYSYIGIILGSMFAFFLGKKIGKPFVNWVIGNENDVDKYLLKFKNKENIVLFFIFLFPFFPDDIICALAGILPIRWTTFFIMQLITRFTSIGSNIVFFSGNLIPSQGWGIVIKIILLIIAVVIFVICYKKADKINEIFDKIIKKFHKK